jgi:hypothetical protein
MTMKLEVQDIALVGAVKYATVHKARAYEDGEPKFSVLVECTADQLAKLVARGVSNRVKLRLDEETGKTFINVTAKATKNDGSPNTMIVEDDKGNKITDLIGNGSTAKVLISLIRTSNGKTVMRLKGLQVSNLIKFVPTEQPKAPGASFNDVDII